MIHVYLLQICIPILPDPFTVKRLNKNTYEDTPKCQLAQNGISTCATEWHFPDCSDPDLDRSGGNEGGIQVKVSVI